jgi:hypothetical protein
MLTIDHVHNDGHIERAGARRSASYTYYNKIIMAGFPSSYQLLCNSCNLSKHINGGTCEHKTTVWSFIKAGVAHAD